MNSIDIKSFLIGILLTATVFFATGWQTGVQKVEIVRVASSAEIGVQVKGFPRGATATAFSPIYVKIAP